MRVADGISAQAAAPSAPRTLSTCPSPFLGQKCDSCRCLVHLSKVTTAPLRVSNASCLSFVARDERERRAFPPRERGRRARIRTRCPLLGLLLCVPAPCHVRSSTLEERNARTPATRSAKRALSPLVAFLAACCCWLQPNPGRTRACCGLFTGYFWNRRGWVSCLCVSVCLCREALQDRGKLNI